jgi:hypothetical protein
MGVVRLAGRFGFLLAILLMSGCGDSGMARVTGTVTVDGVPLEKGSISFFPVESNARTTGGEIKAGQYVVQVPVGQMKVCINAAKVVGKKKFYDTPDSRERTLFAEMLPAEYSSVEDTKLRLEVTPGHIEKSFELTTK